MSAYFGYLIRTFYFRALLAAYAFFVFFGVMPKAPPRSPFQSQFEYMFDTVSRSLAGFAALAVLLAIVCGLWAAIAAVRGLKPPPPSVPDQASDGRPL
ncbi:MAG: hypothetical protein AB7E79_09360 [Rhodospirillaceae bacterium]